MKELSLNILDIAENAVKANATRITITLTEQQGLLTLCIADNGCGMSEEVAAAALNPFYTTRTTRRVGLGLPLLKQEVEMTGGDMTLTSREQAAHPHDHGTTVTARFHTDHVDCLPLGDVPATLVTLIQGHPQTDICFSHRLPDGREVTLDTRTLRATLEDVPLNCYEVLRWIEEFLREQY